MAATMREMIAVQVCYATAEQEFLRSLEVPLGATLEEAVRASGLLQAIPAIDLRQSAVGIFGKKKTLSTILRAQDRVEVYRPLLADPKESRRRRASSAPR